MHNFFYILIQYTMKIIKQMLSLFVFPITKRRETEIILCGNFSPLKISYTRVIYSYKMK